VTFSLFNDRLSARASSAGITIASDLRAQLEAYFRLLTLWNEKINLTALPLGTPTDETFDRLLIEPLAAATYASEPPQAWLDLGSGGGSPAIPFKIAHPTARLTMVESRTRKAAFLREAVRVLGLSDAVVVDERFEAISDERARGLDLVTVRAVKGDAVLFHTIHRLLAARGRVFLFHSPETEPKPPAGMFSTVEMVRLGTAGDARLSILERVFHVEQSR
jgi:16S rRNA (guanine527-N7)-methyltransferase